MSATDRARFRKRDAAALVCAVRQSGLDVARIEVRPDGTIVVITGKPPVDAPANDLDRELADWEVRHGNGQA